MLDFAVITFANTVYLLCHIPPTSKDASAKVKALANEVDCILCGHVHKAWKYNSFTKRDGTTTPVINVGCDVWNYRPVRIDKINDQFLRLRRRK
jgi:calcineurin-like phosphoesterase family protein